MSSAHALMGTTGPFIVGTAVTTFLSGITLMQSFAYFSKNWSSPIDRYVYRWCVVGLSILNLTHTAFCQITLWLWFVEHYGEASSIAQSPWTFGMSPIMGSLAAFVVQLFYAHRLYVLGEGGKVIPCIIAFGSLFQLAWGLGSTIEVFLLMNFSRFQSFEYGVACWFGGAAATDLLITTSLVRCLLHYKTEMSRTKSLIGRIIALTVETNGLTVTIALVDLFVFAFRNDASHVALTICLVQFYINSFLLSLNSRDSNAESSCAFMRTDEKHFTEGSLLQQEGTISSRITSESVSGIRNEFQKPSVGHVDTTASIIVDKLPGCRNSAMNSHNTGMIWLDEGNGHKMDIVGGIEITQVRTVRTTD